MKTKTPIINLSRRLAPALTVLAALAISIPLSAQTSEKYAIDAHTPALATFDAPGGGSGPGQGTFSFAVSAPGDTAGFVRDMANARRGFLRGKKGAFTVFNAPGAGTGNFQGTRAYSMSQSGGIAGWYLDANASNTGGGGTTPAHAYLRDKKGAITIFDAPAAGTGPYPQGTFAYSINSKDTTAGIYTDSSNVTHGFVREKNGNITTIDPAGSIETEIGITALNESGEITGYFLDANSYHGFIRSKKGGFINTFNVPGGKETFASSINPSGDITGYYTDGSGASQGFVRDGNGPFTTFSVPGAGSDPGQGTFPSSINPSGDITGMYVDASDVIHGFVRDANGTITTIDVPSAIITVSNTIDASGDVTGYYIDARGVTHGFLLTK